MYQLFIAHEWMIPSVSDLTGKPEEEIREAWDKAVKKKNTCVIDVPGDLPQMKDCPVCSIRARKDATECRTCGHIYQEA